MLLKVIHSATYVQETNLTPQRCCLESFQQKEEGRGEREGRVQLSKLLTQILYDFLACHKRILLFKPSIRQRSCIYVMYTHIDARIYYTHVPILLQNPSVTKIKVKLAYSKRHPCKTNVTAVFSRKGRHHIFILYFFSPSTARTIFVVEFDSGGTLDRSPSVVVAAIYVRVVMG